MVLTMYYIVMTYYGVKMRRHIWKNNLLMEKAMLEQVIWSFHLHPEVWDFFPRILYIRQTWIKE